MSGWLQYNAFQANAFQAGVTVATCFDAADFNPVDFFTCGAPVTETTHSGLLLDPPKGWKPIGPPMFRANGPLNPRAVVTSIDFNRDDPDELWLLGLTDLETN